MMPTSAAMGPSLRSERGVVYDVHQCLDGTTLKVHGVQILC
jgi:hypothetical protein